MNTRILDNLRTELFSRGFGADGGAPNDTMTLENDYLSEIELADLFDTLIARREKIFRSSEVVGVEPAKRSYSDVVLAIEAIKAVIGRLVLP